MMQAFHRRATVALAATALALGASAHAPPATAQTPKTYSYTITVKTPSDSKTATAAVSVVQMSATSYVLTLTPSGQPAKNIPLSVGADGSIVIAPQAGAAIQADSGARALVANLELAFESALQAKLHGATPLAVHFAVTPVGDGTPVPTLMTMTPSTDPTGVHDFNGTAKAVTTTILPQSSGGGGFNPKATGASAAIGLVAGPVGGIVAGRVIKRKEKKVAQSASSSAHTDNVTVTARSRFAYGKLLAVIGTQNDDVDVDGHTIAIVSNWTLSQQ